MRRLLIFIFLGHSLAQELLFDTFVAGKYKGSYLFEKSDSIYVKNTRLCYNGCCTKGDIEKIASSYNIVNDRIYIYPKKECLKNRGKKSSKKYVKSDSFLLDYIFEKYEKRQNFSFEPQVYLDGLYGYVRLDQEGMSNPFILYPLENSFLQIGFLTPYTPSALVPSTSMYGIGLYSNRWQRELSGFQVPLVIYAPSNVEIYVDNHFVARRFYQPGIYYLDSIPLLYQSGNVRIEIVEEGGRRRTLQIPFIYTPSLIKKNALEYSFAFGSKNNEKVASGHLLYGLNDRWNLLTAFNQSDLALGANFATKFGSVSLELDSQGGAYVNYSYFFAPFSFSISERLEKEQDLRLHLTMVDRFGNLSFYYHRNGTRFYQISYSKAFKRFQLTSSMEYDSLKKDSSIKFSVTIPLYSISNKRGYLTLSRKDQEKNLRLYYPKYQGRKREWGIDLHKRQDSFDARLELRYYNDLWLRRSKRVTSYGLSGSIGCVRVEGIECAIGEYVPAKEAFFIGNGFIKTQPPFFGRRLSNLFTQEEVMLRPGQGYFLDEELHKNLTGTIYLDGEPYAKRYFYIGKRRYFTGIDGSFWVEGQKSLDGLHIRLDGIDA